MQSIRFEKTKSNLWRGILLAGLIYFLGSTLGWGNETIVHIDGAGNLIVTDDQGGNSDDLLTLSLVAGKIRINNGVLEVLADAGMDQVDPFTVDVPPGLITGPQIKLDLRDGSDQVILDLIGGLLPRPLAYTGDAGGMGNDTLTINHGSGTNLVMNYLHASAGDIHLDGAKVVDFTGADPITINGATTNAFLNYSDLAETITLTDPGTAGAIKSDTTIGSSITFTHPSNSLTLFAGTSGGDAIDLDGLGSGFAANLVIDGGTGVDDTLTVSRPIHTGGGDLDLAVGGNIEFSHPVDTGGGAFKVSADSDKNGQGSFILSDRMVTGDRLTPSNTFPDDCFGGTLSISGDTALISNKGHTINGQTGGAFIFIRSGNTWIQQQELLPPPGELFSGGVSIHGDTAVLGAQRADPGGLAYVFVRNGTTWTRQATLAASDTETGDYFGNAVSYFGDTVVVGAFGENEKGTRAGAAYVFTRSGTTWTEEAKLLAPDGVAQSDFGVATYFNGDTAIVGASRASTPGNFRIGAAYAFARSGTNWVLQAKLTDPVPRREAYFGDSLIMDGDTLVVGAYFDSPGGGLPARSGSASVFIQDGTNWQHQAKITASDAAANDFFGIAVSISADTLLIGASEDGDGLGSAYVFTRNGTNWTEHTKLTAFDSMVDDEFGHGLGFYGPNILIGAPGKNDRTGTAYAYTWHTSYWSSGPGDSMVSAADLAWTSSAGNISGTGRLLLEPSTPLSIGVGRGSGAFYLSDTEIANLADGFESITIGNEQAGAIEVDHATFHDPLTLISGSTIRDKSDGGTDLWVPVAETVTLDGEVVPGIFEVHGAVVFASNTLFTAQIGGPQPGRETNFYGQLKVSGDVSIGPQVSLQLVQQGAFTPSTSNRFILIENDGLDPVNGTFEGLGEGAIASTNLFGSGRRFAISYVGGDGNDVILFDAPIPDDTTATINSAGSLFITDSHGGDTDDQLTMSRASDMIRINNGPFALQGATGMAQVDLFTVDVPFALLTGTQIEVDLAGGSDRMTLDLSGGVLPFPIVYHGNASEVESDSLDINRGTGTNLLFTYAHANQGEVHLDGALILAYEGLDPITSTILATHVSLNYSTLPEVIGVRDSGIPGSTRIRSTEGASTTFINPTTSLSIHAGDGGDDHIELHGLGAGFAGNLSIDGGTGSGDTLAVTGPIDSGGGQITFGVGGDVSLFCTVKTAGGDFVVNADSDEDGSGDFVLSDQLVEQAKVVASDGSQQARFGDGIAMNSNTVIIGSRFGDTALDDAGSAYVFIQDGTNWPQQAILTAADPRNFSHFGFAVDVSGNTAVVGAFTDSVSGTTSGSAYVFTRDGTTWSQQQKLTPSTPVVNGYYGTAVSVCGDTIAISAIRDDEKAERAGAVFVYTRNGSTWTEQTKLTAFDGVEVDVFGVSVSLDDDTLAIGASGDDDRGDQSGSAYVYTRSGTSWSIQAKLVAPDGAAGDGFGSSVSLDHHTLGVGSPWDDGTNTDSGSAHIFTRTGTTWSHEAKLMASDAAASDLFGRSVSVSDDSVAIGAPGENIGSLSTGAAYFFTRQGTNWTEKGKLNASDGEAADNLGNAIASDGKTIAVAAVGEDTLGMTTGAAYMFALKTGGWSTKAGDSTLSAADINWIYTANNSGTGKLTLQPSPHQTIGLGGATGDFNVSDDEITTLADGFESIAIGNEQAGAIEVDTARFHDPLTLIGGATISDSNDGDTDLWVPVADTVTLNGEVTPSLFEVHGHVVFASNAVLTVAIDGPAPGAGGHGQLAASGGITLGEAVHLNLLPSESFIPAPSNAFVLIKNNSTHPTLGNFVGLPEHAQLANEVFDSTQPLFITYTGADGNEVIVLPPPHCIDDEFQRLAGNDISIPEYSVTTNDAAILGGALSVIAVGPAASGNASVMIEEGFIVYQPNASNVFSDTFPATISEAGGVTQLCQVTIIVPGDEALVHPAKSITFDGSVSSVAFKGIPGRRYSFEYAENTLPGPLTWEGQGEVTGGADGLILLEQIIGYPSGLYRLTRP